MFPANTLLCTQTTIRSCHVGLMRPSDNLFQNSCTYKLIKILPFRTSVLAKFCITKNRQYKTLSYLAFWSLSPLVLNTSRDLQVFGVIKVKTDAHLVQNTNYSLILFFFKSCHIFMKIIIK